MIYVYNKEGLNDTLLCMIHANNGWNNDTTAELVAEDINVLKQNGQVVGVNILRASQKFEINFEGVLLENDEKFDGEVRAFLTNNGITIENETLYQKVTVGYIEELTAHPDSEKLSVCQVNVGQEELLQIVCGAANVAQGQFVPVAEVGTVMPGGLVIQPSVLRGIDSNGMICSAKELNLPKQFVQPGIMVLDSAEAGQKFFEFFAEMNK